jgi:DNA-binding NtrC family response regulator
MAANRTPSLRRLISARSPAMRELLTLIEKVRDRDAGVLIVGESGTGKDYIAQCLHASGARRAEPFVQIDCAAIPAELFESEMFGHERGAFTDARARRSGKLEAARRGTAYLDNIATLALPLQAKLLRTVQEKEFTPLGGSVALPLRARIMASAPPDIAALVDEGAFRSDLYYRLNVVTVAIPPLRERREDIAPLARRFLGESALRAAREIGAIDPAAIELLEAHSWPGNVRELRNVIERAVIVEPSQTLTAASLPLEGFAAPGDFVQRAGEERWPLERLEAVYIRDVLRRTRNNYSEAAAILGINRKTLLEKRRKYGIDG